MAQEESAPPPSLLQELGIPRLSITWLAQVLSIITAALFVLAIWLNARVFEWWKIDFLQLATAGDIVNSGLHIAALIGPKTLASALGIWLGGRVVPFFYERHLSWVTESFPLLSWSPGIVLSIALAVAVAVNEDALATVVLTATLLGFLLRNSVTNFRNRTKAGASLLGVFLVTVFIVLNLVTIINREISLIRAGGYYSYAPKSVSASTSRSVSSRCLTIAAHPKNSRK